MKYKNKKTQVIQDKFLKTNQINLTFNMIWHMKAAADKVLRDRAFNIAKNSKYNE